MIKKLLTLIVIIGFLSAKAQQVRNITTDAQYFDPETLEFFTRLENGEHTRSYLVVQANREGKYTVTLTECRDTIHLGLYLKHVGKTGNTFIKLKELKKIHTGYKAQLGSMLFEWSYGNSLQVINPHVALIRMRWGDEENSSSTFSFEPYAAISINNALSVYCIAHNNYNYHIVHTGTDFMAYPNQEGKTATLKTDEDITPFLRQHYPITEIFEVNGKQGLKSFDTILIPAVYDKIQVTHFNHTIAWKGGDIHLYYKNGDRVELNGIRAVQITKNDIAVLKGNEVFWVGGNGELWNELVSTKATDKFYSPYLQGLSERGYINIPDYSEGFFEIKGTEGNWELHNVPSTQNSSEIYTNITSQAIFKNITFADNSIKREGIPPFSGMLLIAETTNGQKALLEYNTPQYFIALKPDNYTFSYDFLEGGNLFFEKEGLKGSWPQNKEVRYTQLAQFDKGFARFTLPNGKQGWLALDGIEYLDE